MSATLEPSNKYSGTIELNTTSQFEGGSISPAAGKKGKNWILPNGVKV